MLFTKWLSDITDRVLRKRTRRLARKTRRVARPAAPQSSEQLESRIVPAVITVDYNGGILLVTGSAGTDNLTVENDLGSVTITSSRDTDTFDITTDGDANDEGGGVLTLTGASEVVVNGSGGNDTLNAQDSSNGVTLEGGDGNDVLIGSAVDDSLDGGLGGDRLFGLAGNDSLRVVSGTIH